MKAFQFMQWQMEKDESISVIKLEKRGQTC